MSRRTTPIHSAQPVRLYKIIAITFLILTIGLLAVILFLSSKEARIVITAKHTPSQVRETVTMGANLNDDDAINAQVKTTEVVYSERFSPTGSREEPGIATGIVTLHNETNRDQVLVKTTRLLTPDNVLFRLENNERVPANSTIEAAVYADQEGASGNIGAIERFTIPGLNETLQQSIYGSSDAPMKGGIQTIGILSEEDVSKATKTLTEKMEAEGADVLRSQLGSDRDSAAIFAVSDLELSNDGTIGNELSEFTLSATGTVIGAFYAQADIESWTEEVLRTQIVNDEVHIVPSDAPATVNFERYNAEDQSVDVLVYDEGVLTLNPESKAIDKELFFGKTKEELRRYLLSLDQVKSVDIQFDPSWMQTVPHIHDRVTVIVQEVE